MKAHCLPLSIVAALLPFAQLPAEEKIDFAREILPILSDKCFACHGPDATKAKKLRLDSYEAAVEDAAIDPDDLENSELIYRIHDLNATILHLLGIDHRKLTYRYQGLDFRLTDVHGHIIKDTLL